MNYVRGSNVAHLFSWSSWGVGDAVEAALRELRTALESSHPRWNAGPQVKTHESLRIQSTGTYGPFITKLEQQERPREEDSQLLEDEFRQRPDGDYP
jgi:hypothetical protein